MSERWRAVVGYEGLYEVSDQGRIWSHVSERLLSPWSGGSDHLQVRLVSSDKAQDKYVHRLVLEAFVGPCPEGMEGCHWDDDPTNNRLENLRWDTHSANTFDKVRNGNHNHASKIECKHGHKFTSDNTYLFRGVRNCRACQRERERAYRARKIKEMSNAE